VGDLEASLVEPLPFLRRALDVLVSATMLTILSPLLVLVAILVKATSPGPVFFIQKRAGRGGVPFDFLKFRSMYVDAEDRRAALEEANEKAGPIFKIKKDPRITPLGRFLRKTSIDELPQLLNVLRGDMTLIGPRPPRLDEVEKYAPWQRRRLDITGGLTCIWQVSGRSEVGFEDWVRMDLEYQRRRSVRFDLGLLWRTIGAVVTGRGAY
jgi:lipopolysaccharide/colanic/teichoic acid biosynthesis glycosyltransferase